MKEFFDQAIANIKKLPDRQFLELAQEVGFEAADSDQSQAKPRDEDSGPGLPSKA